MYNCLEFTWYIYYIYIYTYIYIYIYTYTLRQNCTESHLKGFPIAITATGLPPRMERYGP